MNAGNSAVGSTPSSRTSSVVNSDSVRTPSACLTPALPRQLDDRRDEPAQPRAVEATGHAPVAVQVEHDRRVALREHAAEPHGGHVVRALHDHRIGLEVPQLARDAHRQGEVEDEPVERTRPHGLHEVKGVVARRGAVSGGRQDADVGDATERVELLARRLVER